MRDYALFLNGVYDRVLQEILQIQAHLPEQILYLQPYRWAHIAALANEPPTTEDPVRLIVSTTEELATAQYIGEIVGWDDKRKLGGAKLQTLNQVIKYLQPGEKEVYMSAGGTPCLNLLHIRRLKRLAHPFSVAEMTNIKTGRPLSTKRQTSGGWQYVVNPENAWLEAYL